MLFLAAMLAAAGPPQAGRPQGVLGRWQTGVRHGVVQIDRCGASICGRVLSSDGLKANPALTDVNNKDAALRRRPVRNLQILSGFTPDGAGWTGGTIYNAEDGKTYSARVTPVDAATIKVRGCIFVPLCKTQTWTRLP